MRPQGLRFPLLALLAPLAALLLAGCDADPNEEAQLCPKPYILPDAASFAQYDGRGADIANLVLTARLTDVRGACAGQLGKKQEKAHAHVLMLVGRGPAATTRTADISYRVGVMRRGEILDEHGYTQHVTFPPNTDRVELNGQEVTFALPTGKSLNGTDYHIYFWLDLTPQEVAANRQRLPSAANGNAISLAPGQ